MKKMYFLFFFLLITSCNLEPRYVRPCLEDLPCVWRLFQSNDETTAANFRWWEALGDPILNELIFVALNNNKDLQIAIWRVCEYMARYQVVHSKIFPQLGLASSVIRKKFPIQPTFIPFPFNPIVTDYKYAFNLSYELDFWGKIRSESHAAYAEWVAQFENRRVVILSLVGAVAQSYIFLRQLDQELKISYETLESRKKSLDLAYIRFKGGQTSEIEVTQAASVYQETLANITVLEERIPEVENLISVLLGKSPTYILRGRAVDEFCLPTKVPAGLPSELLIRRPDILKAESELIAANALIGAARAAFFPQISLTGLFGGESFELCSLFSKGARAWEIGLKLLQPLFTGGKLVGELKVTQAQKQEAIYHYQQVILNAFREVNDALISHAQAQKRVEAEKGRVGALKEYLRLAWVRYYNGQTDYLIYLDAERHLYEGEIALTRAQGDVFLSLVELYKALGGGWVIDADCNLRCQ